MRIVRLLLYAVLAAALPALAEPPPPKVQEAADRAVPSLTQLFAGLLGARPEAAPEFFIEWERETDRGARIRGDRTTPGRVRIVVSGDEWNDPPRNIDSRLDVSSVRKVSRDVYSTHVCLEGFRIVQRHLSQFSWFSVYAESLQYRQVGVATN